MTELAARLPVSRPAVSQHLRLMLEVGIVEERRHGRERYYSLCRDQLADVDRWLSVSTVSRAVGLDRLGRHLVAEKPDVQKPDVRS